MTRSMRRLARLSCACLALWAAPRGARAEPPAPLTWEECVTLALRRNPELSSSRRASEASRASYYGSFNSLLPRLSLSNSYGDSKGATGASRWGAQATASVDLVNLSNIAGVRSASSSLAQAEANLRLASATLRFNLRRAFAQLLFAGVNEEVSRSIRALRERGSRLVALRYESGRESKGNMLRAKAQYLQAEADLSQSARDLRSAQRSLDRQLGLDDFSAVSATGTLSTQSAPPPPDDLPGLLSQRPDLAASRAAVKAAEAGLASARSALWPSLSANYTRSRADSTEFPAERYSWSVGGVLSLPLFGGGPTATYFQSSAAKKNLGKAEEDLRAARNAAVTDLESSWSSFAGALDQVSVQSALLEAARQRNDEADVRYASGLLGYDNWEIIVSDRISSERQAIVARLNAVNAEAAWERALGKGLGE